MCGNQQFACLKAEFLKTHYYCYDMTIGNLSRLDTQKCVSAFPSSFEVDKEFQQLVQTELSRGMGSLSGEATLNFSFLPPFSVGQLLKE